MGGLTAAARPIERIAIVGVGLIGASLAHALRASDAGVRLVGIDRGAALARAASLGVFDRLDETLSAVEDAELIVLAAPVRQNARLLRELATVVSGPVLVTDTGSTKRAILEAARELPSHISFVGGHPLAGAAQAGAGAARADLFHGRLWLLTPCDATRSPQDLATLQTIVATLGASPRVIDAETHDRVVAAVSHLPQLTASALMYVIGETVGAENLALAGAGLTDTTRLAASPPEIWRDICSTNADAIGPALDALIHVLQRLRSDLPAGDVLADVFGRARHWRSTLDQA